MQAECMHFIYHRKSYKEMCNHSSSVYRISGHCICVNCILDNSIAYLYSYKVYRKLNTKIIYSKIELTDEHMQYCIYQVLRGLSHIATFLKYS